MGSQNNGRIIVADLSHLLNGVPVAKFDDCIEYLDNLPCELYDIDSDMEWGSFSVLRRTVIKAARAAKRKTEQAISRGRRTKGSSDGDLRKNQLAGARANTRKANMAAERLRKVIADFHSIQAGGEISPSALMHHLNDLEIKPPRANRWSITTVKRLIARLAAQKPAGSVS